MIAGSAYAQQLQQEELECDIELAIKKASPLLNEDEINLLYWATGCRKPKPATTDH